MNAERFPRSSGSTLDRRKKEPRAVHSRGLQLALFEALLSRRLGGVGGTGVSRRKGLPQWGFCRTGQGPSVTAITICSISSSRDGIGQIRAAAFPQPSPVGAVFGHHNSYGEWECRERPRETLLVALLSEAPVIALHLARTAGSLFSPKSIGAGTGPKIARRTQRGRRTAMGVFGKRAPSPFNSSQSRTGHHRKEPRAVYALGVAYTGCLQLRLF
jgi:hypothetical protein